MRIAYLVFGYKNPAILARVIRTLSSKDCAFFVHIDQKSNIEPFVKIRNDNVFFTPKRLPVYWAEFSGVQAIMLLMKQALDAPQACEYFVLLSGSEYPIRGSAYIQNFFRENRGAEFINLVKVPNDAAGKPLARINTIRIPSTKPVRRFAVRLLAKIGLARRDYRNHFGALEPYAGNTWWALSRSACQYVWEFVERNPRFAEFFQNAFAPEESFFHTILGNSPFRSKVRRNLVYEDWSSGGAHPAIINDRHLKIFESLAKVEVTDVYGSGEVLFARKFSDGDVDALARIDAMITRKDMLSLSRSKQLEPSDPAMVEGGESRASAISKF